MSATEMALVAPEVEVVAKASRRRFTVEYKRQIVLDGGLDFPDWFALSNEPVNLLKGCLLDPDLSTGRADLGRHILEEVEVSPATFLVGNRCGVKLPATDRAALFFVLDFGFHG